MGCDKISLVKIYSAKEFPSVIAFITHFHYKSIFNCLTLIYALFRLVADKLIVQIVCEMKANNNKRYVWIKMCVRCENSLCYTNCVLGFVCIVESYFMTPEGHYFFVDERYSLSFSVLHLPPASHRIDCPRSYIFLTSRFFFAFARLLTVLACY